MIQKTHITTNYVDLILMYTNGVCPKKTRQLTLCKYLYSKVFFEKVFNKKLSNNSLTSFYSSSRYSAFYSKQAYNLTLFDKNFYYWNNNHFVREYTDISAVSSNFILNNSLDCMYVVIWFYVCYFMVL